MKKPIYKKWWFWVIIVILVIGIGGAASGGGSDSKEQEEQGAKTEAEVPMPQDTAEDKKADPASGTDLPEAEKTDDVQEPEEDIPTEYKSALNKAKTYSDMMHMSKAGIYDQLTSEYGEKFSAEAADYAMEHLEADWNENALIKARDYQNTMDMSPEAIRDQLVSEYGEKFTAEEADYAISHLE